MLQLGEDAPSNIGAKYSGGFSGGASGLWIVKLAQSPGFPE